MPKTYHSLAEVISDFSPSHIVLDSDGTLYPDVAEARRIFDGLLINYLNKKFGYNELKSREFILENKLKYKTESEIGACVQSGIEYLEFYRNVMLPIPLDTLGLERTSGFKDLVKFPDIPVILFTNNSAEFALRIADALGIKQCVKRVFGEIELDYARKPDLRTYEAVNSYIGFSAGTLYIEDSEICLVSEAV